MTDRKIPEGYRLMWVPAGEGWRVGGDGRSCRAPKCFQPAAAAICRKDDRGKDGFVWWYYCENHLYGRKIEDGVVKEERLVRDEEIV